MSETVQLRVPLRDVSVTGRFGPVSPEGAPAHGVGPQGDKNLQAAYERGVRDGEKKLGEQLLQQRAEFLELQTGVLKSVRECVPQIARECERELVALAIESAGKLVAGIPVSAELVEAAVRDVLAQVEEVAEISVSLHPEDLALLQKADSTLLAPASGGPKVLFSSSPEVTRGGCLAQTRFGVIDARRETKLGLLKKAVQS